MNIYVLAGYRAFEHLQTIVEEMKPDALSLFPDQYSEATFTNIQESINAGLQYYQSTYVFNLQKHSPIPTHCIDWLTSDPKETKFQNQCSDGHTESCELCDLMPKVCMALTSMASKIEVKLDTTNHVKVEKWKHIIDQSEKAILEYRNFIVRNKQSDNDWDTYLSTENPEEAIVTFDFAMNHLPAKAR